MKTDEKMSKSDELRNFIAKMRLLLLLPGCLYLIPDVMAQSDTLRTEVTVHKTSVSEVFVFGGSFNGSYTILNLSDFRAWLPATSFIHQDLSNYDQQSYATSEAGSYFGTMIGLIPGHERRTTGKGSPLFRFGFCFENGSYGSIYLSDETSTRYDTLFNSQGQSVYYRDSVEYNNINVEFESSAISTEFSVLLRTNTARRWSFYAGAGMAAGFSMNNRVHAIHEKGTFIEEKSAFNNFGNNTGHSINRNIDDLQVENYNLGSSWTLSGFVPLGIVFRLAKKHELVKHFYMFAEMRPGIRVMGIPGAGSISGSYVLGSFGVRFNWE